MHDKGSGIGVRHESQSSKKMASKKTQNFAKFEASFCFLLQH
jgi:hypothetical protein